ncbi:hypothetical protein [Iodidimonas sp. SYSU 1G8]|uniref:hypothetical protein n=1 Tax=Iodidimonas sp. SYSU 1G8 TaxID=3133967 RepID=UPI0031FF3925
MYPVQSHRTAGKQTGARVAPRVGADPTRLQRWLLKLTTSPFDGAAFNRIQGTPAHAVLRGLADQGWSLRQGSPRNYILWRTGSLIQSSAATVLVLPDGESPLSRWERAVVCLLDAARRQTYRRIALTGEWPGQDDDPWTNPLLRNDVLRQVPPVVAATATQLLDRLYAATAMP